MGKELITFNDSGALKLNLTSIECPFCYLPQIRSMYGTYSVDNDDFFLFCGCVNLECKFGFTVNYDNYNNKLSNVRQADLKKR